MTCVREAKIDDVSQIHALAKELLEQSVYSGIKMDDTRFRTICAHLIGSKSGCVLVVDDEGSVQGFMMGLIDQLFFSRSRYATDLAVYVREAYRSYAPWMFRRFVNWARSKPLVAEITLGISSGIGDTERTGKMYQTLGFQPVGGLYVMRTDG